MPAATWRRPTYWPPRPRPTRCLPPGRPPSRSNGPGLRAVIWFQGCTLSCPGCFNPQTHPTYGGFEVTTERLAAELIARAPTIEGISFSGGEPFQQAEPLLDLVVRLSESPLSLIAFSGYTLSEIQAIPQRPAILNYLDVLIAGRYVEGKHLGHSLLGSSNQHIHLLSERYSTKDFDIVPRRELVLHRDGSITISGIAPWRPS